MHKGNRAEELISASQLEIIKTNCASDEKDSGEAC